MAVCTAMSVHATIYKRAWLIFQLLIAGTLSAELVGMSYVITQKCVGCCDTACVDVCPCDCIVGPVPVDELRAMGLPQKARVQLFIDPDECICCGACVPECPAEAIFHESEVPTEYVGDIELNRRFFAEKARR